MSGAAFALSLNLLIAAMFAASFLVIGLSNKEFRRVLWFAASYLVGMLTPASELLVHYASGEETFVAASYASFSLAFHLMAAGLAAFYRRRVPWLLLGISLAVSLLVRALIWGGQRDTLPYELFYQLPFAVATGLCALMVWRFGTRRPLDLGLGAIFSVIALHFLAKPFLAVVFGSGPTAAAYLKSVYALISQTVTGALLVAAGLVLLLVVMRELLVDSRLAATTDALTGLRNRRGFEDLAGAAVARAARTGLPATVLMSDIDLFKSVNDQFGHHVGDRVIRAFAHVLVSALPRSAIIGRLGGDEFVVLLENTTTVTGRLAAEAIRAGFQSSEVLFDVPGLSATISMGVAGLDHGEPLSDGLRRADTALYAAKRAGRDRVSVAADPETDPELSQARASG